MAVVEVAMCQKLTLAYGRKADAPRVAKESGADVLHAGSWRSASDLKRRLGTSALGPLPWVVLPDRSGAFQSRESGHLRNR